MSGDVVPFNPVQNPMTINEEIVNDLTQGGKFVPQLRLVAGNTGLVTDGKCNANVYALVRSKDDVTDLGREVQVMFLAARAKAIQFNPLIDVYDAGNPQFRDIVARADNPNSGCAYGMEFLIWIPSIKEFATFHFNAKSSRPEARSAINLFNKPAVMKFRVAEKKSSNHKWLIPVVTASSVPFSELPTDEAYQKQMHDFNNPPTTEVESAETESRER